MFLNPYLSQDEETYYETVRSFARDKIFPSAEHRDANEIWDADLWKEMGKAGLNGIAIPEEYGGQGASCLQCCQASEAFNSGGGDGGLGLAWGAHTIIGTMPIVLFGTEEQKQKYLPKLATGELIAGLGLTEPGSGSDAAGLATNAKKNGSGYIMNGSKMFITNGPIGQVFIVMARTQEKKSRGPMGISAFIVDSSNKGFSVSKVLRKLGHHTSTTSELTFDEMPMAEDSLLGPLHSGFMRIGKATLEWERTVLVAAFGGILEYCLEACLKYSLEREQFGKPIFDFYAIKEKLVRNWVYLQSGRRYIYYVARQKDEGDTLAMQSSILKLTTSESGEEVASESVQLHGGYGYMREYHVERFYRDVKLGTIGGGTSEVQRSIIASTFRSYETFMSDLEKMYPENVRNRASDIHKSNLAGAELEVLTAVNSLLQGCWADVKKSKSQSVQFAFADLIMICSLLQQSFWDIGNDLPEYSVDARKRDFALLCWFLIGKYARSFQTLGQIKADLSAAVMQAFQGIKGTDDLVYECAEYLKAGAA